MLISSSRWICARVGDAATSVPFLYIICFRENGTRSESSTDAGAETMVLCKLYGWMDALRFLQPSVGLAMVNAFKMQDLTNSGMGKIGYFNDCFTLKFDGCLFSERSDNSKLISQDFSWVIMQLFQPFYLHGTRCCWVAIKDSSKVFINVVI